MNDNFSNSQTIRKSVVATRGGVVAAQHRRAAEVGAAVLEAGGDAVDAAVATSFAIGVVEPWMSGLAAGGCMLIWRAGDAAAHAVDYGMRSPRELDPADYPLAGEGKALDLFAWPLVKDDRNIQGATAVAVPGVVAGMALAHERFGRMPWRDLIAPAVVLDVSFCQPLKTAGNGIPGGGGSVAPGPSDASRSAAGWLALSVRQNSDVPAVPSVR